MKPYVIISDCHANIWSAFSTVLATGVNSRLQIILDEIKNAADDLDIVDGDTLYITGDLFHVRGAVSPTVLNPLIDTFTEITASGKKIVVLTGNHDLESRNSEELSNSCESLRKIPGVTIVSKPTIFWEERVVMVPWYDSMNDVRAHIGELSKLIVNGDGGDIDPHDLSEFTLMLHVPLNSVLIGIPDHGFWAKELEVLGFHRVFTGHYHHHKEFPGEVYSVGATTHQTWNDVGTVAGRILVTEASVEHVVGGSPKFIDYDISWDDDQAYEAVKGNYVRVRFGEADDDEITMIRDHITGLGAAGVLIQAIPVAKGTATKRTSATVAAPTVRQSVTEWIKANAVSADTTAIDKLCMDIIDEVEAVTV